MSGTQAVHCCRLSDVASQGLTSAWLRGIARGEAGGSVVLDGERLLCQRGVPGVRRVRCMRCWACTRSWSPPQVLGDVGCTMQCGWAAEWVQQPAGPVCAAAGRRVRLCAHLGTTTSTVCSQLCSRCPASQ